MSKYIITREAEVDISEILAFIAADNFDAALNLYDRLIELFEMLADNKFAGRERPELKEDLRSFPEGNYLVFYRKWAGKIAIVRVIHGARDLDEIFS
ncbi:MAG: type II toxin-antitoxin system RelE/ParE family toxin [Pyrinomonadaceae bacterium]|nr:type II toxin-antitoxin system RelE/ParE family toxin [Pyrinomonadaceae bacterium]MBP6213179.1 type II toxin-antitoxin system RelE/ParE family toxin [Pyrinomonadaceae bacterium]